MQNAKCKIMVAFRGAKSNFLNIIKGNIDYRDLVTFKQFEKCLIVDEIKHNISVGVFDSIDGCSAPAVYSAERFIIIFSGF